jgi:hypothetical protein
MVTRWTFSNRTYTFFNIENQRFYLKKHYERDFNINKVYAALKLIPENAAVCAQDEFVSHLAFRKKIYNFPFVADAEYIFLMKDFASYYPLTKEQFDNNLYGEYLYNNNWKVLLDDYPILILRKRTSNDNISNIYKPISSNDIITYSCNADSVAPDKSFFYSNNKDQVFYNVDTRTSEKAFSGKYSVKLTPDKPYGMSTSFKNINKGDLFETTVWELQGGDDDCGIVVSGKTSNSFYLTGQYRIGQNTERMESD